MEATKRLRRRYLQRGLIENPIAPTRMTPPAIREQQRATRGYSAAMPAAEWTDDIARSNQEIADAWAAEEQRRTTLFERGEYTPRFGSVGADMIFEMRTQNVTGLQPALPQLSKKEFGQAATVSELTSQVQAVERSRADRTITRPERPTKREVLDRCEGDEARAAQVEQRLDELFGAEA